MTNDVGITKYNFKKLNPSEASKAHVDQLDKTSH